MAGISLSSWPESDARRGFPWLKAELKRISPDVVFIPTGRWLDCGQVPTVAMIRNMEPLTVPFGGNTFVEGLKNLARAYVAKRACLRASRIIAVSRYVRDFLTGTWGIDPNKVGTVYHGIEPPPDEEKTLKPPALQQSPVGDFLFTAGSIRPARGIEDILHALAAAKERGRILAAAIAGGTDPGTGFYLDRMRNLAEKLGVSGRVLWTGRLSPLEMSWCFHHCKAFVLTSRAEACPNTALEAMSHGCLSISVNHPPMPEFFGDSAIYYKAGNGDELAVRIEQAMNASTLEIEGLRAAARARARCFDWKKTAALTVDQLELAISNRG
jgi:glycosyltransferase involved in cell wall biosynthesis